METIYYLFCLIVIMIISTVLHELAHGWTAYWLGDNTAKLSGRLSFNPLKHIDPFMSVILPALFMLMGMPILAGAKPVPIDTRKVKGGEWGFALVALAGPLTNFILAFIFFLIARFVPVDWIFEIAWIGLYANLGFMLFNLIPIPPLDGSRILYAFAPDGVQDMMRGMERYGFIVIYVLLCFCGGLLGNYLTAAESGILNFFTLITGGAA